MIRQALRNSRALLTAGTRNRALYSARKPTVFEILAHNRSVSTGRAIVFANHGAPKEAITVAKFDLKEPAEGQVLLKLVAAPINPADLNQIEGVYPSKPHFSQDLGTSDSVAIAGNEGLFEVAAVGAGVDNLKEGDWVLPNIASFGTWASHRLVAAKDLVVIQNKEGLDPLAAATVAVNASTAYRMLKDFASLEQGDWFIQNGGASIVGRMAIQLGKLWGFKSISVVRDRRDIEKLTEDLKKLGADHVLTEEQISDKSIRHVIKDWTKGSSIKLALNCVSGRSATNIVRQLSSGGKLVTYGGMSKQPIALGSAMFIFQNIQAHGFWMTRWNAENQDLRERMINELLNMFRNGELSISGLTPAEVDLAAPKDTDFLAPFENALESSGKHVIVAKADQSSGSGVNTGPGSGPGSIASASSIAAKQGTE